MTNGRQVLRVVELTRSVAGAVCGRLFAALGHEVTLCEPSSGHPLRAREFTFTATAAGKRRVVCDPAPGAWDALLSDADVLVHDHTPEQARALGLDAEQLTRHFPRLVTVSITPFGPDGELAEMPGDSMLAEAYGGLAQMIGEPDRTPLSLGGEQAAHAAAFVALMGASLALRRRARLGTGDQVEVALSDVVAYMDWKSDVMHDRGLGTPTRTGAARGSWRIVEAKDGWVGVIYLAHQLPAVVELTGRPTAGADDLWATLTDTIGQRAAVDVYAAAQQLGLPFGHAASAADLLTSEQLLNEGFVLPAERRRRDAPVVAFPVPDSPSVAPYVEPDGEPTGTGPLAGLLVLDFGTITAGAATGRLLADYGATVIKIESSDRPDRFRQWIMPGTDTDSTAVSPMFASNNAGKVGLSVDLKSAGGRRIVHDLIRRADVLVENFRAGVTARMGIDPDTVRELNPALIYLSLSSQGSTGPESTNSSYGCTLDLLSGLASTTGYQGGAPMWSSGDVNYPDQLVALAGAALVAHAAATGRRGALLDISQRELVAWTLADQLAAFVWEGTPMEPTGNRRPGAVPHDVYPTSGGTWVAIACFDNGQRRALAGLVPGLPADRWSARQDDLDIVIAEWTSARSREQAVAELHAAGVPAVPVCTAADRAAQPRYLKRRVALRGPDGEWLKGFPLVMRGFAPPDPGSAPELGEDVSDPTDATIVALMAGVL